jgi:hypothetical protein
MSAQSLKAQSLAARSPAASPSASSTLVSSPLAATIHAASDADRSAPPRRRDAGGAGSQPPGDGPQAADPLVIERLAGWHLPLLSDPAFVPLHPLLQRAAVLRLPAQALHWLRLPAAADLSPGVLVARRGTSPLGLIVSRPVNRSGSCWRVQHLRLAAESHRRELAGELLREAILQARGAASWIATASTVDLDRLAALREQGFQPLRTERLWRLPETAEPDASAGEPVEAWSPRPLNRRTARALWQLEQAACPGLLRQLLDRQPQDLLDQSRGRGWMLIDASRNQAVAAVRRLGEHAGGGHDLELTVHPGWERLIGPPLAGLLAQARRALGHRQPLWLRSDINDQALERWLRQRGAEARGERVLMARSVWRRQELHAPAQGAARRLEAMLDQLRPRRRPLPTPLVRR